MDENKIVLIGDDGTEEIFYVIEETKLNDVSYLLVSNAQEDSEEADAFILKDVSAAGDEEAVYEFVEDDELEAIADIFAELMDEDTDLVR